MLNLIETQELCKSYDDKSIVQGINLNVKQGTVYGLLGENGAGKTTIFKMLSGLIAPTSGQAFVFGKNVVTNRAEIQRKIGLMIDVPVFYEDLSAADNLQLHLDYMGKTANVEKALTAVGLMNTGKHPVGKFSMGMRQRLAIARALVHSPDLLILDEPTNGLDPVGTLGMRTLFTDLVKEQGMTILISSHILNEIQQLANTIGIIAKRVIVHESVVTEIESNFAGGLEQYYMERIGE